jgi:hypothetical protein
MEIRNPKAEIRRKSEIRNPKAWIAMLSGIGSALKCPDRDRSPVAAPRTAFERLASAIAAQGGEVSLHHLNGGGGKEYLSLAGTLGKGLGEGSLCEPPIDTLPIGANLVCELFWRQCGDRAPGLDDERPFPLRNDLGREHDLSGRLGGIVPALRGLTPCALHDFLFSPVGSVSKGTPAP